MAHSDIPDFITTTVRNAGAMAREAFGHVTVAYKESDVPFDVLTETDTAIDTFIKAEIRAHFPLHAIHSEEGDEMMQSSHVWTIDPIDGSSNFSRGIPHFAVCLGLSVDGVPVAGAVYNPITEELFSFEQGKGAWRNGEPLVPTTRTTLAGSTLLFTIGSRRENWPWGLSLYEKLLHAEARVRNLGASALDVCYVAAGRVDGVVYGGGSLRDISCAVGILRASGGEVYLFETGDIAPLDATPRRIIATGSEVFASTIRLLN